jgi:hypothetical protein
MLHKQLRVKKNIQTQDHTLFSHKRLGQICALSPLPLTVLSNL